MEATRTGTPACAAMRAASTLVAIPPVPTPLRFAEPRVTAARSAGATVSMSCAGPDAGVAVVDAVDVGQKHQHVGLGDVRDQRGQPVVVAEPDLLGGHGVVLVDDRQRAEREQPLQSRCALR